MGLKQLWDILNLFNVEHSSLGLYTHCLLSKHLQEMLTPWSKVGLGTSITRRLSKHCHDKLKNAVLESHPPQWTIFWPRAGSPGWEVTCILNPEETFLLFFYSEEIDSSEACVEFFFSKSSSCQRQFADLIFIFCCFTFFHIMRTQLLYRQLIKSRQTSQILVITMLQYRVGQSWFSSGLHNTADLKSNIIFLKHGCLVRTCERRREPENEKKKKEGENETETDMEREPGRGRERGRTKIVILPPLWGPTSEQCPKTECFSWTNSWHASVEHCLPWGRSWGGHLKGWWRRLWEKEAENNTKRWSDKLIVQAK